MRVSVYVTADSLLRKCVSGAPGLLAARPGHNQIRLLLPGEQRAAEVAQRQRATWRPHQQEVRVARRVRGRRCTDAPTTQLAVKFSEL